MGLFKLPYDDDVYIQISGYDCLRLKSIDPNMSSDQPWVWVVVGPLGNKPQKELEVRGYNSDTGYSIDFFKEPRLDCDNLIELAHAATCVLITLLATRNIIKTTKVNKLAKLGIGGKKDLLKRFAYTTTITIPDDLDDHESVRPGGPRCPHLRRGHIRRQRFGPGRQHEKKIWIAPVFVNADPDFVNQRAAYNINARVAS
jgi:hypothetical protein